jgi:dTMP kinase
VTAGRSPGLSPGKFITIEGGEGAGKSTQARLLLAALSRELAMIGAAVIATREPGGSPAAEAVRSLLLGHGPWDPISECMLHFTARREHVETTIRPALASGIWVVCDRFSDSTLAYQCYGQGVQRSVFDALASITLEELKPDLTFVLDIKPTDGLRRAEVRGDTNRYERMSNEFHARVHAGFREIAKAEPDRCLLLDASNSQADLQEEMLSTVRTRFALGAAG